LRVLIVDYRKNCLTGAQSISPYGRNDTVGLVCREMGRVQVYFESREKNLPITPQRYTMVMNLPMIIKETHPKSILSPSKIFPYVVNAYTGCQHNCTYCYAKFMKRFTGHPEPWGEFVDAKISAPELLRKEIGKKKPDRVWVSGVCDPYQPLEARYKLTRQCLEILIENDWPVHIQTRSPLVTRDIDVLQKGRDVQVCLSITTADDNVRAMFEPHAPPIQARIHALEELHRAGLRTSVMIAPMLSGCEDLPEWLEGKMDNVILDRMNYHNADQVYRKYGLEDKMTDEYFDGTRRLLHAAFARQGIPCRG
jgi:DNA repair photolyase